MTAPNDKQPRIYKDIAAAPLTKAQKIQELAALIDEIFEIKAKLQKTDGGKIDGKYRV